MKTQFIPTKISFTDAEILAVNHKDVGVFEAATGDWFCFNDPDWCWMGIKRSAHDILTDLTVAGMDKKYIFVWLRLVE